MIGFIEFNLGFFQLQGQHNLLRQPWPSSHYINEIFEFTTDDRARENPWKKTVTGSKQLLPEQIILLAAVHLMPVEGCAGSPCPAWQHSPRHQRLGQPKPPFLGCCQAAVSAQTLELTGFLHWKKCA